MTTPKPVVVGEPVTVEIWKVEYRVPRNRFYSRSNWGTWTTYCTRSTRDEALAAWNRETMHRPQSVTEIRVRRIRVVTTTLEMEEMAVKPVKRPATPRGERGPAILEELLRFPRS